MKKRESNRWIEPRKDSKGRLLCLIPTCNNLREKYKTGNRKRNYCKKHTWVGMRQFTNWQDLRLKALKRDNHTCIKCGDKRKDVELTRKRRIWMNMEKMYNGTDKKCIYKYVDYKCVVNNFIVDHIKPIALGGDEWNLKNIQTLCFKCNKIKTAKDMKNIAKQRRIEKKLKD